MAKRKPPKGSDIPEWVVTYGDLMSLLLCFFILLVAFSEPKKPEEFRKVLEKIREALGFKGGLGVADISHSAGNTQITTMQSARNRAEDGKFMDENTTPQVPGEASNVTIVQDGNQHAIGGSLAFAPGSTSLSLDVKAKLRDVIARQIRDKKYIVRIVGHSWGPQDQTQGSHLVVSFERAMAVHDYLVNECGVDPIILRIVSAGDQEPSVEHSGTNPSSNRRVQVFMTDKTVDQVHPDPFGTGRGKD
jgi:chemotaxis protein MotB